MSDNEFSSETACLIYDLNMNNVLSGLARIPPKFYASSVPMELTTKLARIRELRRAEGIEWHAGNRVWQVPAPARDRTSYLSEIDARVNSAHQEMHNAFMANLRNFGRGIVYGAPAIGLSGTVRVPVPMPEMSEMRVNGEVIVIEDLENIFANMTYRIEAMGLPPGVAVVSTPSPIDDATQRVINRTALENADERDTERAFRDACGCDECNDYDDDSIDD